MAISGQRPNHNPGWLQRGGILIRCRAATNNLPHAQSHGGLFEVFTPEQRYVFASSAEHIREIDAASDEVLSLQAAAKRVSEIGRIRVKPIHS